MPPEASRRAGLFWLVLGVLLGAALTGAGVYFLHLRPLSFPSLTGQPPPTNSEGPEREADSIGAPGRLQPTGGVIAVYGPTGERIARLLVRQGEEVKEDQPLAVLHSKEDREEDRKLAREQLDAAEAQKKAIRAAGAARLAVIDAEAAQASETRADDLKAQDEKIRALEAQRKAARAQLDRLRSLDVRRASVSAQEMDQQRLRVRQAESELRAAEALRKKTDTTYKANEKTLPARRRSAEAETNQALAAVPEATARQNLALAERRLRLTTVRAPVAGTVLKTTAHVGETIGPTPILQLGSGGLAVVAQVFATDVGKLRGWLARGEVKAEVKHKALPETLHGTLRDPKRIAGITDRRTGISLTTGTDADRPYFEVRIDLDPASSKVASRYVGQEVTVTLTPAPKP
jgi:HlyD family secretion protein